MNTANKNLERKVSTLEETIKNEQRTETELGTRVKELYQNLQDRTILLETTQQQVQLLTLQLEQSSKLEIEKKK
jgi:hypothetical protein